MPSPFPGMDPWLEDPHGWPNVHLDLISEIKAVLTRQLRPKYYARAEQRVYVSDQDDPGRRVIAPDVRVIARSGRRSPSLQGAGGQTAVATEIEPLVLTTLIEDEMHEPYIEVIDRAQRRVVTVVEVVSPTNKVPGARGQDSYRRKRSEVMRSATHFVEIDLLRDGEPLVAAEALPRGDYFVHVSRIEERPSGTVWPIRLSQRLPSVPIPLLPEDPDAPLDLQAVLDAAYDRNGYELDVDYRDDPDSPLPGQWSEWADRLLREKGLRE